MVRDVGIVLYIELFLIGFFRCIGVVGTRTQARDVREKKEQAIKKKKECLGIDGK